MSRRKIREQIFKMLFQIEFYEKDEMDEQIQIEMDALSDVDSEKQAYIE